MSKVLITGATGFIGDGVVRNLLREGHEVIALVRNLAKAENRFSNSIKYQSWDFKSELELPDCDKIINLAGEPILGKRWSAPQRRLLETSRIMETRFLVDAVKRSSRKPQALINASAIGFYGDRGNEKLDETSDGRSDFLATLCRDWENEALKAQELGLRVVMLRTGIVLGRGGGALHKMLPPFRMGVGGPIASGKQWMSWIHYDDEVGLTLHALNSDVVKGPINLVAPHPKTNYEFTKTLGSVLHRPAFLPVPAFVLKVAFGEASELLTSSAQVFPKVALGSRYSFKFPELKGALENLLD